mmetsp:Transcript_41196/g.104825  ORF Transcript_41196/g.104825 Transcript_41196/m.104825 type:complete len:407 (+) Transcript_41196:502-1722(+)
MTAGECKQGLPHRFGLCRRLWVASDCTCGVEHVPPEWSHATNAEGSAQLVLQHGGLGVVEPQLVQLAVLRDEVEVRRTRRGIPTEACRDLADVAHARRADVAVEEIHDVHEGDLRTGGIATIDASEGRKLELAEVVFGAGGVQTGVLISVPRCAHNQLVRGYSQLQIQARAVRSQRERGVGGRNAPVIDLRACVVAHDVQEVTCIGQGLVVVEAAVDARGRPCRADRGLGARQRRVQGRGGLPHQRHIVALLLRRGRAWVLVQRVLEVKSDAVQKLAFQRRDQLIDPSLPHFFVRREDQLRRPSDDPGAGQVGPADELRVLTPGHRRDNVPIEGAPIAGAEAEELVLVPDRRCLAQGCVFTGARCLSVGQMNQPHRFMQRTRSTLQSPSCQQNAPPRQQRTRRPQR